MVIAQGPQAIVRFDRTNMRRSKARKMHFVRFSPPAVLLDEPFEAQELDG